MPALSSYSNVEETAIRILASKGFRLWLDEEIYCCERNGWDFYADSFVELLGLVSIYEYQGAPGKYNEYWWRVEGVPREEIVLKEKAH